MQRYAVRRSHYSGAGVQVRCASARNLRRVEMKQYAYLVVALLVACSDYGGGSKPATSSSSKEPANSTSPAASPTSSAASPAKRDKLENSPLVWKPTTSVSS